MITTARIAPAIVEPSVLASSKAVVTSVGTAAIADEIEARAKANNAANLCVIFFMVFFLVGSECKPVLWGLWFWACARLLGLMASSCAGPIGPNSDGVFI